MLYREAWGGEGPSWYQAPHQAPWQWGVGLKVDSACPLGGAGGGLFISLPPRASIFSFPFLFFVFFPEKTLMICLGEYMLSHLRPVISIFHYEDMWFINHSLAHQASHPSVLGLLAVGNPTIYFICVLSKISLKPQV